MFIMETKSIGKKIDFLKYSLGFYGCLAVSSDGHSGDVVLYWCKNTEVEIISYSKHHCDAWLVDANSQTK